MQAGTGVPKLHAHRERDRDEERHDHEQSSRRRVAEELLRRTDRVRRRTTSGAEFGGTDVNP